MHLLASLIVTKCQGQSSQEKLPQLFNYVIALLNPVLQFKLHKISCLFNIASELWFPILRIFFIVVIIYPLSILYIYSTQVLIYISSPKLEWYSVWSTCITFWLVTTIKYLNRLFMSWSLYQGLGSLFSDCKLWNPSMVKI